MTDGKLIEQHLKAFERLDDRLGEAVFDLKHDENLDLPVAIRRDLEEIEMAITRVKYSLRDRLQLALLD